MGAVRWSDPVAFEPVATAARTIRIGLLGCGNVGSALVPLVERQSEAIEARTGLRLEITRVAVRNLSRDRGITLAEGVLTRDALAWSPIPTSISWSR